MDWIAKLPQWAIAVSLMAIAMAFGYIVIAKPKEFKFFDWGFGVVTLEEIPSNSNPFVTLPAGVIISSVSRCDIFGPGWSEYEHGYGRVIVGAGKPTQKQYQTSSYPYWKPSHLPKTQENRKKLKIYEIEASGGEETIKITKDRMPSHVHGLGTIGIKDVTPVDADSDLRKLDVPWYLNGSSYLKEGLVDSDSDNPIMQPSGGSKPHNNMPPYIALYYCKKD